ncbi:DUF1131 family protein [Polycladidibacter stylochi]|uniref:DUF1131 family protein n=1 Tax=Polycladidibacter stylochi TaxID=1807766 RepID=UPI00138F70AB|nr:DUF1131 family protein [Pseudovibrio stylochi]
MVDKGDLEATPPPKNSGFVIGSNHVGDITAQTPYQLEQFSKIPSVSKVEKTRTTLPLHSVNALSLIDREGQQELLVIGKTQINSIQGIGPKVVGPNGEKIGDSFQSTKMQVNQCKAGLNLWFRLLICKVKTNENIKLVFTAPGYDGNPDFLPNKNVLKKSTLKKIVWSPPVPKDDNQPLQHKDKVKNS